MSSVKHILSRPADLCLSAFAAWCASAALCGFGEVAFTSRDFAATLSLPLFLGAWVILFAALCALSLRHPRAFWRAAPLCALFYGAVCCARSHDLYTALGFMIVMAILLVYVLREDRVGLDGFALPRYALPAILAACGAAMAAYLITAALMRYAAYNSPCYDFGIFAQMFHSMKTTGLPVTTCEREVAMSHFAVHVSPIYYLLLPFYLLLPRPETLLVLQVLALLSGVIPLCLLCRHKGLSNTVTLAVGLLYLSCAALTGGIFYDFHENKFLTACLLWLLWAIEKRRWPLIALFAALTLGVKEDAAVYVLFIGLWLLLARPEKKTGAALSVGAAGYFLAVTAWLNTHGDGAMFDRFANLVSEGGVAALLRTAILNPGLLLHECMTADKLLYAACVLLPLGLIPLMSRKLSDLILVCPFVVVNLLSDYTYQHSLNFQYGYGSVALLFYLTVINLPHLPALRSGFPLRRALLCFGLCAACLVGVVQIHRHQPVFNYYTERREDSAAIAEVLAEIPADAAVRSSSMFVAHLAAREELYYLTNEVTAEYVVLDLRPYINISSARGYDVEYFERRGYELLTEVEDVIALLRRLPAEGE